MAWIFILGLLIIEHGLEVKLSEGWYILGIIGLLFYPRTYNVNLVTNKER